MKRLIRHKGHIGLLTPTTRPLPRGLLRYEEVVHVIHFTLATMFLYAGLLGWRFNWEVGLMYSIQVRYYSLSIPVSPCSCESPFHTSITMSLHVSIPYQCHHVPVCLYSIPVPPCLYSIPVPPCLHSIPVPPCYMSPFHTRTTVLLYISTSYKYHQFTICLHSIPCCCICGCVSLRR